MAAAQKRDPHAELVEDIARFTHDPLGYVLYAFPWGVKGTQLEKHSGPRKWQRAYLTKLGHRLKAGTLFPDEVIQEATATGHGVGKSALVAMIVMWAMSTMPNCRAVVTANTEGQLTTKTWPELSKWHSMAINGYWFTFTATSLYSPTSEKNWRADAIPWSKDNSEAFAGLHNEGRRILLIFDEASAIDNKIWEVAEGALTDADTEILWLAFGNPTRNVGRFFDCFHQLKHRWGTLQLDSRTVEGTNLTFLNSLVEDNGEDSDIARIRVRGVFPRTSMMQLISRELLEEAMARKLPHVAHGSEVAIVGVDVARFGMNQSVIATRIGREASTHLPIKMIGNDTVKVADRVALHVNFLRRAGLQVVVFVDGGGVGGGVIDNLRHAGYEVVEVNFGGKAGDEKKYANKRTEMYCLFVDWMKTGALPHDEDMLIEGPAIDYTWTKTDQRILTRKERMIEELGISPDTCDAYALTFAHPVSEVPLTVTAQEAQAARGGEVRRNHDPRVAAQRR